MKNVLESLKESVKSGKITIREAAIKLHKAGWTSFVDVDKTKQLLELCVIVKTCSDSLFSIGQKNCQLFVAKLRNFLDSHNRMVLY